ncbi:MAG: hypothetical protein JNM31_10295 [Flavobacteriales bacterium]|nr:hypothetical protein [Flavobacteriales bacterium]
MRTTDRSFLLLTLAALAVMGCDRASRGAKEALNKGGEMAGRAASEVAEGVVTGAAAAWSIDVALDSSLQAAGLVLGVTEVAADSAGRNNRVHVYLSSARAVNETVQAVAYDKDGRECGRTAVVLNLGTNSGDYHELRFQARTDLTRKSRVLIARN